jgi:carboxylate-amine ligase
MLLLEENKWRAMRYGLDAQLVDFGRARCLPARDALHQLLDFVDEVVDDLGSQAEMLTLRRLLESPQGTGADQQLTVFARTGDPHQVVWSLYEKARSFCVPEETIKAARPEIRV